MLDLHLKMCIIAVQGTDSRGQEPGFPSWLYHLIISGSTSSGPGGRERGEERGGNDSSVS